jgi:predicted DNA-binding transcriptional regulator YafY
VNEDSIVRQALAERFGIHDSIERERHTVILEMQKGPALFLKNRSWHPTQVFREENGRWFMEFSCIINIELIGWIFSWLEHVKVVAPNFLREMMAERAEYIGRMYREGLPPVQPANTDNPFTVGG